MEAQLRYSPKLPGLEMDLDTMYMLLDILSYLPLQFQNRGRKKRELYSVFIARRTSKVSLITTNLVDIRFRHSCLPADCIMLRRATAGCTNGQVHGVLLDGVAPSECKFLPLDRIISGRPKLYMPLGKVL